LVGHLQFGYGVDPKAAAERVIALKELDGTMQITNDQTAFDYAVAVLDSPLGLLTGWVGCRTYKASWNGLNV
jgi:hypothetical protein